MRLFRRHYRDYERRMADYFSDDERRRLLWVSHSFYAALAIGILALLYALCPTTLTSLLFTLVIAVYYAVFAIRFINYAFMFQQIETAITIDSPTPQSQPRPLPCREGSKMSSSSTLNTIYSLPSQGAVEGGSAALGLLMSRLSALMASERLYAKPDLTIEEVAVLVGESHRTVSAAINSTMGLNYKTWVNIYRVEEAQRLIRDGYLNGHTIDALAEAVGFANRISFYRNFKKHTGQSPVGYN